jgi:hypothetical protein
VSSKRGLNVQSRIRTHLKTIWVQVHGGGLYSNFTPPAREVALWAGQPREQLRAHLMLHKGPFSRRKKRRHTTASLVDRRCIVLRPSAQICELTDLSRPSWIRPSQRTSCMSMMSKRHDGVWK